MKPKTLTILTIVFAILVGIWGVQSLDLMPSNSVWDKTFGIKKDAITSIRLQKGDTSVELKKEGDSWMSDGKRVDSVKVTNLLNALYPASTPNLISRSNGRHETLGVTTDKGTSIVLNDNKKVVVGNYSFPGSYVRLVEGDSVYLVNNLDTATISTLQNDWLDTKITAILPTNITNIETSFDKKTRIFTKDGSDWKEGDNKIETGEVSSFLSTFESFNGNSVINQEEAEKYKNDNDARLKFVWNGGEEQLTLRKGESDYLVIRSRDSMNFTISTSTFDSLKKSLEEI